MQEWYSNGYFEPSLPVRHVDDPTFEALGSFLARWPGLTPFKDEAADYVRRKEASQLQQQQPGFGAFGWPGQTQQAPQQQAAQLAQQNAALQEIAALAASGALSLSPQALVLLLQQLQAQQTVIERMAQQGQLAGTMGQLGVGAGGLGAVGGLGIGGLPQVPQVPLMPGILTGGSGGGFSLFGEGTGAVDATRREDQIQLQPEAVPERPVAEVVPEASEAPAPPAPEQLEPEPIAAPALLPAADAPEEPIATDVAPAEEVFVSEPIVADKEKKKKDKKKDGMGKQAVATVDAELADAAAAEALLKAEEAANEAARKAAWEQKQAAPTTPSLREIQEMEEREREKQRKRKEQATKTALAEEIARAQAEQEAVAKIQQATAAWSAPKGKKLSMQEIMAEEERKERERKAKLEAQRAAAVQAAPPGIGESWSATRRFADAVGNSPSASPAPAWGGMKPMSVPAGSPVKPSGIAVVAVTGPIVRPPAAAPAPISTAQASPSDGQDSWHTVGARGSTQSPTVARGLSSPSPVPASSTPGKVSSFSGKDKGPSDDFMKWCRSALKPVVAGGPVNGAYHHQRIACVHVSPACRSRRLCFYASFVPYERYVDDYDGMRGHARLYDCNRPA